MGAEHRDFIHEAAQSSREGTIPGPGDFLTEKELYRLIRAMVRGLDHQGRNEFTRADIRSAINWVNETRSRMLILEFVLKDRLDVLPSPDGDKKKVMFCGRRKGVPIRPKRFVTDVLN